MEINLKNLKINNYSEIINIGSTCTVGICLQELKLNKEKIPIFNDVVTNPRVIYDCLKTDFINYKKLNGPMKYKDNIIYEFLKMHKSETLDNYIHNEYGIYFLYQLNYNLNELNDLIELQINIFKRKLISDKFLIFIFTSEDTIGYKPCLENQDENYKYLKMIEEFFINNYPKLKFKILAFHTNKDYKNTNNIINFNVNVDKENIEDDIFRNNMKNITKYRDLMTETLKKILL